MSATENILTLQQAQQLLRSIQAGDAGEIIPFTLQNKNAAGTSSTEMLCIKQNEGDLSDIEAVLRSAKAETRLFNSRYVRSLMHGKFGQEKADALIKEYDATYSYVDMREVAEHYGILSSRGSTAKKDIIIMPKTAFETFMNLNELPQKKSKGREAPKLINPESPHISNRAGRQLSVEDS